MSRIAILGAAMIYFYSAGAQGASPAATRVPSDQLGRSVRVVTISFQNKSLETIRDLVEAEAAKGTDVIVLPETWRGQKNNTSETLAGPTVSVMARIAAKYHTYIVCPIDRKDGVRRYNSAVFLDRNGQVISVYNKVYSYWSEFDLKQPVTVGDEAPVYQADFGRVGFAICFNVNFPSALAIRSSTISRANRSCTRRARTLT